MHRILNKKIILGGICGIIVIALCIYKIFFSGGEANPDTLVVTRGQLAKSIALVMHTKEECAASEDQYGINSEEWYIKYMNMMYADDYFDKEDIKATRREATKAITYSDLQGVLDKMNIVDEEINSIIDSYQPRDKVYGSEFSKLYIRILTDIQALDESKVFETEFVPLCTPSNDKKLNAWQSVTNIGKYSFEGLSMDYYLDTRVNAVVKDGEILWITGIIDNTIQYVNTYVEKVEDNVLYTFINGTHREFKVDDNVQELSAGTITDITLTNKKVVKVAVKSDTISGKVLVSDKNYIDISGYGQIILDENCKIYKNYGEIEMGDFSNVVVGYDNQNFVVAEGKICAILINNQADGENIRVLISNTGFKSQTHESISFSSDEDFNITYGDKTETLKAGAMITLNSDSPYLSDGRIVVKTVSDAGKVKINSIKRSYGEAEYRGTIEIVKKGTALNIINELSIEDYLYAVVPSEMPSSYPAEALKAQAICARSYAYKHILNNSCSSEGAHVNDTTTFQVYNSSKEQESTNSAVDETCGDILKCGDEIVTAYFFSTSCGSTADATIWGSSGVPYIKGVMLTNQETHLDLTKEEDFNTFISQDYDTYDKDYAWYRWHITFSKDKISTIVNRTIKEIIGSRPTSVLVKKSDGTFAQGTVSGIGTVNTISVCKRGNGGVAEEVLIEGTENTVKICTQSSIRNLIDPEGNSIVKNDGSENKSLKMLPSGFFMIKNNSNGEFEFVGGGYGHGVGLSQNASKTMAENGMKCEDILKFFYNNVEITDCYKKDSEK